MVDRSDVRTTYQAIADHFAETRAYPWPEVESFCEGRHVDTALDVGCGNGRHVELLVDHADFVIGIDASSRLCTLARGRVPTAGYVVGDASNLPLADDRVSLALYVATIHHLPSRELRIRSLDELARVLDSAGTGLVSSWSTAHDRFEVDTDADTGFDTTIDWTLPDGETVPRYYHIYSPREFDSDLAASDLEVVSSRISSGNCYAVVEGTE